MNRVRHILLLCLLFSALFQTSLQAQRDTIRYVDPVNGSFRGDGRSWRNAKNRLQDAINDLHIYLEENHLQGGSVYVVGGKYVPSESTETAGGGLLSTSFKIYEGIHIYGGFAPDAPEDTPAERVMENGKTWAENQAAIEAVGTSENVVEPWRFRHKTVLTGNHSSVNTTFTFDATRGRFDMVYPGNSYHVVWFATNGLIEDEKTPGHYYGLNSPALLDGVTIREGYASNKQTDERYHNSYGGGAYMVSGSTISNSVIEYCAAALRGGGVYMDGGGEVRNCFINTCQASGVGIVQGYGGGVCIDYDGVLSHSYVTQCASRIGAGLAICHVPGEYPATITEIANLSPYSPYANSSIISNCTSNAEGGGVYLDEGGTINHCTVVRNRCIGPNLVYYGRRHGRSGGVYILDRGMVYNSVMWGNECAANNNIQFAVHVNQTDSATIDIYHSALENHDITDWTGVMKDVVFSVNKENFPQRGVVGNFVCFTNPTATAGVLADADGALPATIAAAERWHPQPISALAMKGVQITDAVQGASVWALHAHTRTDLLGNTFEPVSSLGALVRENETAQYALVVEQSKENKGDNKKIPTLFVDPQRQDTALMTGTVGLSWDKPLENLGDALQYFKQYIVETPTRVYYRLPVYNSDGTESGSFEDYEFVQILVKAGTLTTAGPGNYLGLELRTASIRMASNMRLYAAYPSQNRGTDTSGRNPREITTRISANITGGNDETAFQNNAAHVITFVNAQNAIVDGFRLYNANAHNLETTYSAAAGGGVLVNNRTTAQAMRRDMTGNELRNCVIANCYAPKGVAVYVNGEYKKADGSPSRAELKVVNCVMRNCTADYQEQDEESSVNHGIITANGNAKIWLNHCTVVNNVGYAIKTDDVATEDDSALPYEGEIEVNNTCVFANGNRLRDDRVNILHPLTVWEHSAGHITGEYNMFDFDATLTSGLTTANHNSCVFTRTDRNDRNYPVFVNPSRNVGHSPDDDKPLYGGVVSYMPMNTNPVVNAASPESVNGTDRSDIELRNYGGAADIGAVENTNLPKAGTVLYVTPNGAGKRDGSSWANAIAGNTVYRLYNAPAAEGDSIDEASDARLINKSSGDPVLTIDNRYRGGFGAYYLRENSTTTNHIYTWNTNITTYIGGDKDGTTETTVASEPVETEEVLENVVADGEIPPLALNSSFPYGEISGASRALWRATGNTIPMNINGTYRDDYTGTKSLDGMLESGLVHLGNERYENYVSGLQWAVEEAARRNHAATRIAGEEYDSPVQVWVGAGIYNDYKGYIMRDSVTVLGGFPSSKYASPGLTERQALLADDTPISEGGNGSVSIPKSTNVQQLDAHDYETILQVSDINPRTDNANFNQSAILFSDDGSTYIQNKTVTNYLYKQSTITQTMQYVTATRWENETDDYLRYADMKSMSRTDLGKTDNVQKYNYGPANAKTEDYWRVNYPVKDNYIVDISSNSTTLSVYDYDTEDFIEKKSSSWIRFGNGSLTDLHFWQTMADVEQGTYRLTLDLMGGYRNDPVKANTFDFETPSNIYLHIFDKDDNELITPLLFKGMSGITGKDNARTTALRKTVEFTLTEAAAGDVRIEVIVGEGTRNKSGFPTATDPTEDGRDPDVIPDNYRWDADNKEWGTRNPNRREMFMTNLQLERQVLGGTYELVSSTTSTSDYAGEVEGGRRESTIETTVSKDSNTATNLTTVRKRVLQMPDVCNPVYGASEGSPSKAAGDGLAHTERVLKEGRTSLGSSNKRYIDPFYKEYAEAIWDGFTIRHGFIYDQSTAHGGGAGVCLFEGGHLRNSIVTDNMAAAEKQKGGGVFCDGVTATIEGCFILNNSTIKGSSANQSQEFSGGLFIYEGTCFNTLIANNYSEGPGGGLGLVAGKFYNNTVAYNTARTDVGGVRIANNADPSILMANTIIYGNSGRALSITGEPSQGVQISPFIHCYIQSKDKITFDKFINAIESPEENTKGFGVENIFLNGEAVSKDNTPFEADINPATGEYTGNAQQTNNFNLRQTDNINCINRGTEDFESKMFEGLKYEKYPNVDVLTPAQETAIRSDNRYKTVVDVFLPQNDVVFANRVQDCQVDIGAYEFDGSMEITPEMDTVVVSLSDGGSETRIYARFYVQAKRTVQGLASADSPENAACEMKFQKVLDAAGRYKDKNPTHWVVVRMAGDEAETGYATYRPQRSTLAIGNVNNLTDYSIIVPHGVTLEGGWNDDYTERDPLQYKTVLSGYAENRETGSTDAQVYHVVTFTNDLFTTDEKPFLDERNQYTYNQLARLTANRDRAVLDGLFIENGYANGADDHNRRGGAAVVTSYAHINNCVLRQNKATAYGGALYMQPGALLTGSILKGDTAAMGGAVYVEALDLFREKVGADTYSHIYSCTFVGNHATTRAGGLWLQNNALINSSVFWKNTSSDLNNIVIASTTGETGAQVYPFNYCAVESRKVDGVNNIELSPAASEGVRWDSTAWYEDILTKQIRYYPISMSSSLARAGMIYSNYNELMTLFPTMTDRDIAGVSRMTQTGNDTIGSHIYLQKNNDFIEMGARAINVNFAVQVQDNVIMKRLFVVKSKELASAEALALQRNEGTTRQDLLYKQMGSSFANPFHRFGDALDYIIQVRKDNKQYRDTTFEVFLSGGEYQPYHDSRGNISEARASTFVIPEGVTIIGGLDPVVQESETEKAYYCQRGYASYSKLPDIEIAGVRFQSCPTDTIRLRRQMTDVNLNNIIEPWEFASQTILTGSTTSGDENTNIYHIITCVSDSNYVGCLPSHYTDTARTKRVTTSDDEEHITSRARRSIILDGITFQDGHANDLDSIDEQKVIRQKTYFRGGAIFVDGNMDNLNVADDAMPTVLDKAKHNIPLVVANCQFQNNMAANGGAIYTNGSLRVYGSSFVQNYSRGPNTERDRRHIPWSAGGAIAANGYCEVVNSLFANNEAMRGELTIDEKNVTEKIVDADRRQGYGGVITASEDATVHALNCNFVRNRAQAYPAIFNFLSNRHYSPLRDPEDEVYGNHEKHFAVNCVFWGNEAVLEPDDEYHYPQEIMNIGYLESDRQDAERTAANEALFFCAYEKEQGSEATRNLDERDFRRQPVPYYGIGDEQNQDSLVMRDMLAQLGGYNHNIILSADNNASDGPNFIQPSPSAGIDGYMQQADWLVSRLNSLTDHGWGSLHQTVDRKIDHYEYIKTNNEIESYPDWNAVLEAEKAGLLDAKQVYAIYTGSAYVEFTPDTVDHIGQLVGNGLYNRFAYFIKDLYHLTLMPIGAEKYIAYSRRSTDTQLDMARISSNPLLTMGSSNVFIDIGMYEYQYVQLNVDGHEIDTVWVTSGSEIEDADGSTWEKATSNVQVAIETLLRSRNNHDKYVCFIGGLEAEPAVYSPAYMTNNHLAFSISTPGSGDSNLSNDDLNKYIYLPHDAINDKYYGIKSLNFLGGYSPETKEVERNPEAYPVHLRMQPLSTTAANSEMAHVVHIVDMQQKVSRRNYIGMFDFYPDTIVPVTFDGFTFINPYGEKEEAATGGGSAILYDRQFKNIDKEGDLDVPLHAPKDGSPKLTIRNCKFEAVSYNYKDESDPALVPSAVRILQGGHRSLIVNSLFHSGAGNPIVAEPIAALKMDEVGDSVAQNPVTVLNCTFALNGGHLRLTDPASEVLNSIIWRDDQKSGEAVQYEVATLRHNAITGIEADVLNDNDPLATDNSSVIAGPNFLQPLVAVTEFDSMLMRSFRLNPGKLTMNRGDSALYHTIMGKLPAQDFDLAHQARLKGQNLERGAYECVARLQRVLYADPKNEINDDADGSNWERAFVGEDAIQKAIEVASIYASLHKEQAYVFSRNSTDGTATPISMRNGVSIYGSIETTFQDTAMLDDLGSCDNDEIARYVNYVRATKKGIAATSGTRVAGVVAEPQSDDDPLMRLLDGFEIANGITPITFSPIAINTDSVVLRNCLVHNNRMDADVPVVDMQNGLLYNSLVYGNSYLDDQTHTRVRVGDKGLILNCTLVTDHHGSITVDATADNSVVNTITLNIMDSTLSRSGNAQAFLRCNETIGMFAPYMQQNNPYEIDPSFTGNIPLHYQLHERSKVIDAGLMQEQVIAANPRFSKYFTPHIKGNEKKNHLLAACNFLHDRDMLGNPRVLGFNGADTIIDLGCYETWRIHGTTVATTTTDENYDINFGGNYYPHPNSVIYIAENSNLLLQEGQFDGQKPSEREAQHPTIRPCYLLLGDGASLYAQGNTLQADYIAIEKAVQNQRYQMLSLPFTISLNNLAQVFYDSETDIMTGKLYRAEGMPYKYNAARRAAHDYRFAADNSSCWELITSDTLYANEGLLIDLMERKTGREIMRYTAWNSELGQYCYEEKDGADKVVWLQQNDQRNPQGAQFTQAEDMGWNMVGMPFLVSHYRTAQNADGDYQMDIPHVFYQMSENPLFAQTDQMAALRSWDEGATLTLGQAFLTQTATAAEKEALHFRQPQYEAAATAPLPYEVWLLSDATGKGDYLQVKPTDDASLKQLRYRMGRDGVHWLNADGVPQISLLTADGITPLSLAMDAPRETDLQLLVNAPAGDYTFQLGNSSDFGSTTHVYLTDHLTGVTTDLLVADYAFNAVANINASDRFTLRFGGKKVAPAPRRTSAYCVSHTVYISGLQAGDHVALFSSTGTLLEQFTATAPTATALVPQDGIYAVTCSDNQSLNETHKLIALP